MAGRRRRSARCQRRRMCLEPRTPRRLSVGRGRRAALRGPRMTERFDFIVIGAGASGEAAASYARARGATVALVERDLFGGTCAFWGCMPSKTLLHAAEIRACGGDYPWEKASARRDYMIVREGRDYPDDSGHIKGYKAAGTVPVRGSAKIAGPGKVVVRTDDGARELEARDIIIAVGSIGKVPKLEGLAEAGFWTNKEGTSLRELPKSIAILGVGRELSTHLGHYEGETAVKIALGDDVRADFSATPRAVYTDPETAAVGLLVDQAKERGIDAFEQTANLATSAKGYVSESEGHVSVVIDRKNKVVVGAFSGGPAAPEGVHD